MEKREIGILIALVFGVLVIGFGGKFTGKVVSEALVDCNIADFNADGIVNHIDKVDFAREYDLNYGTENYCGPLDVNNDRKISIIDSNIYADLYSDNYKKYTGECQRKLICEELQSELEPELETEPYLLIEEQPGLAEEKPGLIKRIRDFLRDLF